MPAARARVALLLLVGCGRLGFDAQQGTDAVVADTSVDGANTTLLDGCVLRLAMDEPAWTGAAGEVVNACPSLSGRAVGGAVPADDPLRGRVGSFGGGTSCIEIGDAPELRAVDQLTMSAWVFPTALDGVTPFGIVSKRAGFQVESEYTMFVWTGDTAWVDLDTENDRFGSVAPLVPSTWTQLTVVFDGRLGGAERVRVYRDGALEHVAPESSAKLPAFGSPLRVGCMPDALGDDVSFVGRLDDVMVWTRALGPVEVTAWFDATRR